MTDDEFDAPLSDEELMALAHGELQYFECDLLCSRTQAHTHTVVLQLCWFYL